MNFDQKLLNATAKTTSRQFISQAPLFNSRRQSFLYFLILYFNLLFSSI